MAITSIGNRLKEYQNSPVLQRNVFRNRAMNAADARGPYGLLASSPELINAVVQNQIQPSVTPANFMGFDQQPDAGTVAPNTGTIDVPTMPVPRLDNSATDSTVENPVVKPKMSKPKRKPSETATQPLPKSESDTAPKPKKSTKSKSDTALKNFTDRLSELRGTETPKTKKDRLKEAKEFLKEAGVSDVDDIRTSKDFMLMTLGLNIAAGQSGDFLTNVATGAKETLGTFGELKAKEKEAERAVNLAAAEMAKADYDAAIARGAKLDEAELEMLTKQYEASLGPDDLQTARVVAEENGIPVLDALKQIKGSKSQTASSIILEAIQRDFKNIKGYFLRQLNTAGGLKYIGENFTEAAIADGLGVDINTPEGKREVEVFMGIARNAPPASLDRIEVPDGEQSDSGSSGDGIKIEPMN
tara:strand:+ start:266 stop:1510 length:1245 start_codon:yes stop_codon:yes gene_type:complete